MSNYLWPNKKMGVIELDPSPRGISLNPTLT